MVTKNGTGSETVSDGQYLGFTNHDTKINFDGIDFLPNYGGNAQAREYTEGLDSSDNSEVTFIFSTEAISRQDLLDGKYRGAKFTEWIVDWNDPTKRFKIATGYLGRTTTYHNQHGGLDFKIEMRSLLARFQQKSYFLTVKLCPKTFGSQELGDCRKNLFGLVDDLEITEIVNAVSFRTNSTRDVENFYGEITFTSGSRANITKLVDSYDATTQIITLRNSEGTLAIGDTLSALAKCDKSYRACLDFDNAVNHGGFPHLPGADKANRTNRL